MKNIDLGTDLYTANKQLSKNDPLMTAPEIAGKQNLIKEWFEKNVPSYAMLLCNDRRDYTVFHQGGKNASYAAGEVIGCCTDRGKLVTIDKTKDNAWEIWLRVGKEDYCYYLFDYTPAVIECY